MAPSQGSKVAILIATYNGEKYLQKQLESLFSQSGCEVEVIVNDDGSVDGTAHILKEYQNLGLIKEILHTKNVGPSLAFFNLLLHSSGYEYLALCDQDDIWDEDKIEVSISELGTSSPAISISDRRYIDDQDSVVGFSRKISKPLSLRNALVENVAYGNTIVMNSKARSLVVRSAPIGVDLDHWIYMVISAIGQVNHIPKPLVSYRLHGSNHVGTSRLKAIFVFRQSSRKIRRSAQKLLSGYSEELSLNDTQTLQIYLRIWNIKSPFSKIYSILYSGLYRQNKADTFVYKIGLFFVSLFGSNLSQDSE